MHKIKKYSGILSKLFYALAILYPVALLLVWSFYPELSQKTKYDISPVTPEQVTWNTKTWLAIMAINIPYALIMGFISLSLARLFKSFSRGKVFAYENCKLLKKVVVFLCLSVLFNIFADSLMSLALTFQNAPGERLLNVSISSHHFSTLMLAFIIYVISMIQAEACRLAEESQFTV